MNPIYIDQKRVTQLCYQLRHINEKSGDYTHPPLNLVCVCVERQLGLLIDQNFQFLSRSLIRIIYIV